MKNNYISETAGVGEVKNKSQIALLEQNYNSSTGLFTHTGNFVKDAYDVIELENKKMHWHTKVSAAYPSGELISEEYEYDIIFELQKKK